MATHTKEVKAPTTRVRLVVGPERGFPLEVEGLGAFASSESG